MEQEMTTRPSIRPQDIVASLSGDVVANTAACVECDLYLIATPVAAVCASERRNAATSHDPISINRSQRATDQAGDCYRLLLHNHNRLFLLRPFKGAAAADLPVVIVPWDQIELVRVLPDYRSCQ
jgi:hypothetical protein